MSRVFERTIDDVVVESGCDYDFVLDMYDYIIWDAQPNMENEQFAEIVNKFDWSVRGDKRFKDILMELSEESGYKYDFLFEHFVNMVCDPDDDGDWTYFVGVTMEHDW